MGKKIVSAILDILLLICCLSIWMDMVTMNEKVDLLMEENLALKESFAYKEQNNETKELVPIGDDKLTEQVETEVYQDYIYQFCGFSNILKIPEEDMSKFILYEYVQYGLEKYCEEKGIEDIFSCDVSEFSRLKYTVNFNPNKGFRIDLAKDIIPSLQNNLYNFYLQGKHTNLYMQINTYMMKIYIYDAPGEKEKYIDSGKNPLFKEEIYEEDGMMNYTKDIVQSEWEDLPLEFFAERADDSISNRVINDSTYGPSPTDIIYVISYAVDRYCDETEIEDVFHWNPEIDAIGFSGGKIYTLRVRGENHTLYIDYDGYQERIHVYPVE